MNIKYFRCAILGGIVVFLWATFSWMVLPWQQMRIKQFHNEAEVSQVIRANALDDGMYYLPNLFGRNGESRMHGEEGKGRLARGPVMFAAVRPFGIVPKMGEEILISIILNSIGALFITFMVVQMKADYWRRVWYITLFGLAVGLLGLFPLWNWWSFCFSYVAVGTMDLIVGWFLAGLLISKLLGRASKV